MAGTLVQEAVSRVNGRVARRRLFFGLVFLVGGVAGTAVTGGTQLVQIGGVVGLIFLMTTIPPVLRRMSPESHEHVAPLLAHYGITVEQLSMHIEAERGRPVQPPTASGIEVLPSYVLWNRDAAFALIRTDDVLWLYQHTTIHRTNGAETGRSNSLVFCTAYAPELRLLMSASPRELLEVFAAVCTQVPWAMQGYSPQLDVAWGDPAKRAQMLEVLKLKRAAAGVRLGG